jgi:VWFA-related protein
MPRRLFLVFILSGILLAAAGAVYGQFRSRVDLVVVPVSVRDNNGVLLTGLTKEDFSITEDRKPQTISNFSVDPQPLSVAIVVDDGVNGPALKRVFALLHSMTSAFTPDDELTSYRYDHVVSKLSDFTKDHAEIEKSFEQLDHIADTRPGEPDEPEIYKKIEKKTPGIAKTLANIFVLGSIGAPKNGPGPSIPSGPPAPRSAPDSRIMHTAINEAATALQTRPKEFRKIILLVSDGMVAEPQISVIPGKTRNTFDKNVELLLKNEIQIYAVNTAESLLERSSTMLHSYADSTGGDVYGGKSDSDMKFAFNRIGEQARSEYVLGYVSTNSAPTQGIYRKIEVTSGGKDQKRNVTHRQGYIQYPIPE